MRHPIGAKVRGDIKCRTVEDQASVLGANEDSLRHIEVGAGSVEEGNPSLRVSPHDVSGTEDQTAQAGLDKRCDALHREAKRVGPRNFILVGVSPERPGARIVTHSIARVAVIDFDTLMPGEEESVARQDAPAIGRALSNAVTVCLLQKCSHELN